jgi:PAS domain-containing protein
MDEPHRRQSRSAAETASGPLDELERAVIDNLYDGVYYVDRGRRIRYWNHGAERLTGYGATDVVGHFCYDNILNHVDDKGTFLCRSLCPLAAIGPPIMRSLASITETWEGTTGT